MLTRLRILGQTTISRAGAFKGSVKGATGASGYAPGQKMQNKGSVKGEPGPSGYAPGHSGKK